MQASLENIVGRFTKSLSRDLSRLIESQLKEEVRRAVKEAPASLKASPKRRLSDDAMQCHHKGCKNRSKGPRFKFLCEKHVDVHATVAEQTNRKTKAQKYVKPTKKTAGHQED
jgi:hypothetical protein